MRSRFGILIAIAVLFQLTALPVAAATPAGEEACFAQAINSERTSRGLAPLSVDTDLTAYARWHTQRMIAAGGLFHSTAAQLTAALPDGWTGWAENVGYAANCARLHRAFMESPGHRANLLNDRHTRMAIGVGFSSNGTLWATEIFYSHPEPLGLPPFWDDDGSPHEADIIVLAEAGITGGCGDGRFCPDASLSRAQMAVFLTRALDLPDTSIDYFTDDDGSPFEAEINAVAAAGITSGCGTGVYCPNANVTRGQMAAFVTSAFGLPPTAADFFTDDGRSLHEADINALAAAGITSGCAPGLFCPDDTLTRAQMASFLARALGW